MALQISQISLAMLLMGLAPAGAAHELKVEETPETQPRDVRALIQIYHLDSEAFSPLWSSPDTKMETLNIAARPLTRPTHAFIYSVQNDNSAYHMFMSVERTPAPESGRYLMIGPGLFTTNASAYARDGQLYALSYNLTAWQARSAAEDLGIAIADRKPMKLELELVPLQETYEVGQPMPVEVRLKNPGDVDLRFRLPSKHGVKSGLENSDLFFYVTDADGAFRRTDRHTERSSYANRVIIKAGEAHVRTVDLAEWLDFLEIGNYEIVTSYKTQAYGIDYADCFGTNAKHPRTAAAIWDLTVRATATIKVVEPR